MSRRMISTPLGPSAMTSPKRDLRLRYKNRYWFSRSSCYRCEHHLLCIVIQSHRHLRMNHYFVLKCIFPLAQSSRDLSSRLEFYL